MSSNVIINELTLKRNERWLSLEFYIIETNSIIDLGESVCHNDWQDWYYAKIDWLKIDDC